MGSEWVRGAKDPDSRSPDVCRTPRSARGINLNQVVVVLSEARRQRQGHRRPLLKSRRKLAHKFGRGCAFIVRGCKLSPVFGV